MKEAIKTAGYTQVLIAKELKISANSLSSKMTGKSEFTLREAKKIIELLDIKEDKQKVEIFLE
ncbi:MAG: helix-turn-helix domain-containing protein [Ruminococcus sp.]